MRKKWIKHLKNNRSLLLFLSLMLVFRSAVADWNHVPSGSMKPTIVEGDRLLVNKMAYDIRLPFTHISLLKLADPQRGDIIIFDSQAAANKLVKRVIALPGDRVAMQDNRLSINGRELDYRVQTTQSDSLDAMEALPGKHHLVRLNKRGSSLDSFGPITVSPEHYLALGDNRDASADSRIIGLIPRHEITGRAQTIAFSNDPKQYYWFRAERWMQPL